MTSICCWMSELPCIASLHASTLQIGWRNWGWTAARLHCSWSTASFNVPLDSDDNELMMLHIPNKVDFKPESNTNEQESTQACVFLGRWRSLGVGQTPEEKKEQNPGCWEGPRLLCRGGHACVWQSTEKVDITHSSLGRQAGALPAQGHWLHLLAVLQHVVPLGSGESSKRHLPPAPLQPKTCNACCTLAVCASGSSKSCQGELHLCVSLSMPLFNMSSVSPGSCNSASPKTSEWEWKCLFVCDHISCVHLTPVTICPSKVLEACVSVSSPRTLVAFAVYDIHDTHQRVSAWDYTNMKGFLINGK